MTIYITGGSNTAKPGGWSDKFAARIVRKYAVRNLALGATNSHMAFIRVMRDAQLGPGDAVVWANSTNDAMCMSEGHYSDFALIGYVEQMIRLCAETGARFIPLIIDSYNKLVDVEQAEYKRRILALLEHYSLPWIDLRAAYFGETGEADLPRHFFMDPLHFNADSPVTDFIGDLAIEAVESGLGHPAKTSPMSDDAKCRFEVVSEFGPTQQSARFENSVANLATWKPPFASTPLSPSGAAEVDALVVVAGSEGGAFTISVGAQSLSFSACHCFGYWPKPGLLIVRPRNLLAEGLRIGTGDKIKVDWCDSPANLKADMYFRGNLEPHQLGQSQSRIAYAVLKHHAD
ncbi:SGNH/GDSL hydrolase family protein [Actibacterium lipolyticum]|uniref:Uncharacterized protein n=1 Tax=Actibacterium lipolyticum TaxID=1524263 RepID=A0A238JPP6_9RHOB|nr:SGNH/GDSL hydrolase family protein [Actibacterium lipolyticum]SMX32164.1 hypothetical protein COL8621_00729 [Actibacterium lipolyticum]